MQSKGWANRSLPLCLGNNDGGMQVVLCVHASDAQRIIVVGLDCRPAAESSAKVCTLSPEETKQAIQGYLDGVGEPRSSGVQIVTQVTLGDELSDELSDELVQPVGFHRLNAQVLLLTPDMYADPVSSMKAGLEAVVGEEYAWCRPALVA